MKQLQDDGSVLILQSKLAGNSIARSGRLFVNYDEITTGDNGDGTYHVRITWSLNDGNEYYYRMGRYTAELASDLRDALTRLSRDKFDVSQGGELYNFSMRRATFSKEKVP